MIAVLVIVGLLAIFLNIAAWYGKKKTGARNQNGNNKYDSDYDDRFSGERWSSDGKRLR
jgi:hypothetical protein